MIGSSLGPSDTPNSEHTKTKVCCGNLQFSVSYEQSVFSKICDFDGRCIFGIAGACRRDELQKLSIDDIEEVGSIIIVKVPRSKTDKERSFVIKGEVEEGLNLIDIYHKYTKLRASHIYSA
ncbi:hypothetical protein NQ317_012702 [Molorchus minor]|uniref:K Homology domain-containing protein n=1 Tax=Molorchus minor TaxID=1323400 RepID=A0ABQ9JLC0_9CUCU|nr:hypothetical protein NQ317_012702 [Molorchus minor]